MADLLDLLDDMTADRLPCGHKAGSGLGWGWDVAASDEREHAEDCLNLTCPRCHLSEVNYYHLLTGHGIRYDGLCQAQGWAFDRVAHCMACRWPTFGQWPCRNLACPLHECSDECAAEAKQIGRLDTHPWGEYAKLGREGLQPWPLGAAS